jgi:bile acid:Na+ symporter, BASS family
MSIVMLCVLVMKLSVLLLVFALGLQATASQAGYLFRQPARLLRAFIAMAVVVPFVAAGTALLLDLPRPIELAMIAMSISPVPPILPRKQLKQGARADYVYGLLIAAALLSIVAVPFAVWMLGLVFHREAHFGPLEVAKVVGLTVVAPVALGILVRRQLPAQAERAAPLLMRGGTVLMMAALLPVLVKVWPAIWSLLSYGTLQAVVVVILAAIATGHLLGGPNREDRVALAIASAMRHPGVALAILKENAPNDKVLPAVLLYVLVATVLTGVYSAVRKRMAGEGPVASAAGT